MYAVTSCPLVSFTLATLRRAEFGFFGVIVVTFVHTPRFCGHPLFILTVLFLRVLKSVCMAGDFDLFLLLLRGFLMSWLIVGTVGSY